MNKMKFGEELDYPVLIKDVLPQKWFAILGDEFVSGWRYNNVSQRYEDGIFWGMPDKENNSIISLCSSIIKLKIQRHLKRDIRVLNRHINGQTHGQPGSFHHDYPQEYTWTFILFCAPFWNTNWGGEFVCHNPIKNEYKYVPYIPNTGCLIPSQWEHYGSCPNNKCNSLRTSIGFCFCEEDKYPQLVREIKELQVNTFDF